MAPPSWPAIIWDPSAEMAEQIQFPVGTLVTEIQAALELVDKYKVPEVPAITLLASAEQVRVVQFAKGAVARLQGAESAKPRGAQTMAAARMMSW